MYLLGTPRNWYGGLEGRDSRFRVRAGGLRHLGVSLRYRSSGYLSPESELHRVQAVYFTALLYSGSEKAQGLRGASGIRQGHHHLLQRY